MVLGSLNIDYSSSDTSSLTFNDVSKTSWNAKVIAKAVELKIVESDNINFNPNRFVSRAEAMKILMGAYWFTFDSEAVSNFMDVSWWPIKYIEKATELWIVNWQIFNWNPYFKPLDNISRAEVAKIIIRTMDIK